MDVQYILHWWILLFLLGIISLPFTSIIFRRFADRGYAFAKLVSLLSIGYVIWLLGSLHLVIYSRTEIIVIGALLVIASGIFGYRTQFLSTLKNKKLLIRIAIEEIIFLLGLGAWAYVRSWNPSINQVEKFMDFGILNSLLRTSYFPPQDMWYAGFSLNYYYYGHFLASILVKVSQIPAAIAFNLLIAFIFAQSVIAVLSILLTLTRSYFYGFFSVINLILIGNLDLFYNLITNIKKVGFSLNVLKGTITNYYFASATRVVPDSINEFPLYSYFVADLHAHFLDIPTVLLSLALLLELYLEDSILLEIPPALFFFPLVLGTIFPTNSWDYFVYAFLFLVILLWKSWKDIGKWGKLFITHLLTAASLYISVISVSLLLFLPFFLSFSPPVGGIGINTISHTTPDQFFRMWGYFVTLAIMYAISIGILYLKRIPLKKESTFISFIVVTAIFLLIVPEVVFLKDIYFYRNPPYFRANTMFKVYFQAWILLAVASGYIIATITSIPSKIKLLFLPLVYLLLAGCFLIPLNIVGNRTFLLTFQGLNGLSYMKLQNPQTLASINWINAHIQGRPVIVEAAGDSYTQYARISANTGLPTIIGWAEHEYGWRYGPAIWTQISNREGDVRTIYTTSDITQEVNLLSIYHVQYIYIGDLEQQEYKDINWDTLRSVGHIVYQTPSVTIFKVNSSV